MTEEMLCRAAIDALEKAYAPYSGFRVGAALMTADGRVYTGCNIENAAYTPTVCAERTAFFKAVSEGQRRFAMLAVACRHNGRLQSRFPPCGVCRQVMAEFCGADFPVLTVTGENSYDQYTLGQLLPMGFSPGNLEKEESADGNGGDH